MAQEDRADRTGTAARIAREGLVTPLFQSVIDIVSRRILGFEILSRGVFPLESPVEMLSAAREASMPWEMECACIEACLGAAGRAASDLPGMIFFLNISEGFLGDRRLVEKLSAESLRKYGISPGSIAIEIQGQAIATRRDAPTVCRIWRDQGFLLSIDDAPADAMEHLSSLGPAFVKLPAGLTRTVAEYGTSAQDVRKALSVCEKAGGRVVAKAVETVAQIEELASLGVRAFQGYLISRPQTAPPFLSSDMVTECLRIVSTIRASETRRDRIGLMAEDCLCIEAGTMTCEQLDDRFRRDPDLGHAVVVDAGRPVGLVTRTHFYLSTGGRFGYAVFQFKPVEQGSKRSFLMVGDGVSSSEVASRAMSRPLEDVYDPAVVVDRGGMLAGTVTIRKLLERANEDGRTGRDGLEPLTGLPGPVMSLRHLAEILPLKVFTFALIDLDGLRAFNYGFGFERGDEFIRVTAEVLGDHAPLIAQGSFIGHLRGGAFCLVTFREVRDESLDNFCRDFDSRARVMFAPADLERGCYFVGTRSAGLVRVPLNTVSVCVLTGENFGPGVHPAFVVEAAQTLRKACRKRNQETGISNYLRESRTYRSSSASGRAVRLQESAPGAGEAGS